MDLEKVKQLIQLIEETSVSEIEISEGNESVRISKASQVAASVTTTPQPVTTNVASAIDLEPVTPEKGLAGHVVRSPMVGTLYVSHAPDADAFVNVGDHVNTGDTICIIEAMKTFNKIEADASGIIKARLVDNGKPVEYDQPLFVISED